MQMRLSNIHRRSGEKTKLHIFSQLSTQTIQIHTFQNNMITKSNYYVCARNLVLNYLDIVRSINWQRPAL